MPRLALDLDLSIGLGGPTGFSPRKLPSVRMWLDADAAGADGTLLSSWSDLSGHGTAPTAAGSARPTVKTNIINGKSIVRFDGVANVMESLLANSAATGTLFVVGWLRATAANSGFFNQHATTGDDFDTGHWTIYEGPAGTDIGPYSNGSLSGFSTLSTVAPFYFTTRFNGVNNLSRINGVAGTASAFTGTFAATRTGIGARFTGGAYATFNQIDLGTIIFCSGGESDANILLTEAWLTRKYSL